MRAKQHQPSPEQISNGMEWQMEVGGEAAEAAGEWEGDGFCGRTKTSSSLCVENNKTKMYKGKVFMAHNLQQKN